MTAGAAAGLWADLIGDPEKRLLAPTPAKAAKSANRKDWRGSAPAADQCEALRISANSDRETTAAVADSQEFAGVRNPANRTASEQPRGLSQDSQDSQGCPEAKHCDPLSLDLAAVAWTDADIARFLDRRARLVRWGWAEPSAEKLAERLAIRDRDREHDERVNCTDCGHYRPGRCSNHRRAGLHGSEVGHDLAAMLQRCPGFKLRGE